VANDMVEVGSGVVVVVCTGRILVEDRRCSCNVKGRVMVCCDGGSKAGIDLKLGSNDQEDVFGCKIYMYVNAEDLFCRRESQVCECIAQGS
jgi:hypothetical protein